MKCGTTFSRNRRRFPTALLAIAVAISAATLTGGREDAFKVVNVQGVLVHLRSDVPKRLDHMNVKRHLKPGEAFWVERIVYGPRLEGADEAWCFVTSFNNPEEKGWINSRFLLERPGHYSPEARAVTSRMPAVAQTPESSTVHQAVPAVLPPVSPMPPSPPAVPTSTGRTAQVPPSKTGDTADILSIIASLATLIATLIGFAIPWYFYSSPRPALAPQPSMTVHASPFFVYGNSWHIPVKH